MRFTFEDINDELFDRVIAFSYSIGSGLGGPGAIYLLTNDGKEYLIGEEGFEGDWIRPGNIFPFMSEAFGSDDNGSWVRISKKYSLERIFFRRELQSGADTTIENYCKKNESHGVIVWQPLVWQWAMDTSFAQI